MYAVKAVFNEFGVKLSSRMGINQSEVRASPIIYAASFITGESSESSRSEWTITRLNVTSQVYVLYIRKESFDNVETAMPGSMGTR